MQTPTPTHAFVTPAKMKTFVQANGAMLAEQVVTEYQQTSYEILRFVHSDASGTGVQQTLADGTLTNSSIRTAEYDAMGRNIADPGPYVMLNTNVPTENGSGIDLFGNGEGYRPGRMTYKVNGFPVPESAFMAHIGSFAFDLIQVAARMSRMQFAGYSLRHNNGEVTFEGFDEARAISRMEGGETLVRNWLVNDSWSVITMIIPQTGGKPAPLNADENEKLNRRIEKIKERLASERCKKFLTSKLGEDAIKRLLEALDDQSLRFSARRSTEITVEQAGVYGAYARSSLELQLLTAKRSERGSIRNTLKMLDLTVREWVSLPENRNVRAFVGSGRAVYYVEFNSVTAIIHENLHISTGKNDKDLACLLGAGCDFKTAREASPKISEILQKNGCT